MFWESIHPIQGGSRKVRLIRYAYAIIGVLLLIRCWRNIRLFFAASVSHLAYDALSHLNWAVVMSQWFQLLLSTSYSDR